MTGVDLRIAWSTVSNRETAASIARTLVEERLVACVNIIAGITSIYRWQGEIASEDEVLLVMKTRADRIDALQARLLALHPYDVPEFLVQRVEDGSSGYLRWIAEEVS